LISSLRISVEDTGNNLKRDRDTQFLRRIQRNDTLELQQRILAITPTERKRRGINKSTLWYQKKKKKLADGKKMKLYHKVLTKLA
jgi:hypothetical protein